MWHRSLELKKKKELSKPGKGRNGKSQKQVLAKGWGAYPSGFWHSNTGFYGKTKQVPWAILTKR